MFIDLDDHRQEDSQSLRNMMRNRVRPKIGKVDIDYQKLHDAFFKYQTKPRMTQHGDIYYEVIQSLTFSP